MIRSGGFTRLHNRLSVVIISTGSNGNTGVSTQLMVIDGPERGCVGQSWSSSSLLRWVVHTCSLDPPHPSVSNGACLELSESGNGPNLTIGDGKWMISIMYKENHPRASIYTILNFNFPLRSILELHRKPRGGGDNPYTMRFYF
jgi:hypothetical protein